MRWRATALTLDYSSECGSLRAVQTELLAPSKYSVPPKRQVAAKGRVHGSRLRSDRPPGIALGDGRGVTSAEFLEPLNIQPGEAEATHADGGVWASGVIYLAIIRLSAFAHIDTSADAGAQSEAFFASIVEAFRGSARFLDRRPPSVTAALRAAGLSLCLFVDVRMDQDQMELELPSELLAACGGTILACT